MSTANIIQSAIEIWSGAFCIIILILGYRNDKKLGGTVWALWKMLLAAGLLILFDSFTYIFRYSHESWQVRIVKLSIFMVFFLQECLHMMVSVRLNLLIHKSKKLTKDPYLIINLILLGITMLGLFTNPFTGIYYYFDIQNNYIRNAAILLPFYVPVLATLINCINIIRHKNVLSHRIWNFFLACFFLIGISVLMQVLFAGLGLVNVAMVFCILVMYAGAWLNKQELMVEVALESVGIQTSTDNKNVDSTI